MSEARTRTIKTSFSTKLLYAAVLLTCLRVWLGPITILSKAQAQIPDSGQQLYSIITQAKQTNVLLGEIKQLLKSGTINVRVKDADK